MSYFQTDAREGKTNPHGGVAVSYCTRSESSHPWWALANRFRELRESTTTLEAMDFELGGLHNPYQVEVVLKVRMLLRTKKYVRQTGGIEEESRSMMTAFSGGHPSYLMW